MLLIISFKLRLRKIEFYSDIDMIILNICIYTYVKSELYENILRLKVLLKDWNLDHWILEL